MEKNAKVNHLGSDSNTPFKDCAENNFEIFPEKIKADLKM